METRILEFPSILGILFLFACFVSHTEATFDLECFQRKLVALEKVLDYIYERPSQMNVDATFGVTLTEANLAAALLHDNMQYLNEYSFIFNDLKKMVALSDMTRRKLINIIPTNGTEFLLQSVLTDPNIWIKSILWMKIFPKVRLASNQKLSYWAIEESLWNGAPNGTESNQCLAEIIRSNLNGECQIPETCVEILMRDDGSTGYPLTHRLFIVKVAKTLGCRETKSAPFSYLIPAYCTKIFQELVNLEASNFPYLVHDLVMEQIVLCGTEGYHEFVDKHYEDLILSWPDQSGCFSFRSPEKRARRSSSTTDFGCNNHITGLGAASISLFIRENIENAFNPS